MSTSPVNKNISHIKVPPKNIFFMKPYISPWLRTLYLCVIRVKYTQKILSFDQLKTGYFMLLAQKNTGTGI